MKLTTTTTVTAIAKCIGVFGAAYIAGYTLMVVLL